MLQVYIPALMLCCFRSLTSTHIFQRVLTASKDSCEEIQFKIQGSQYFIISSEKLKCALSVT